jgi:hypothetical protein
MDANFMKPIKLKETKEIMMKSLGISLSFGHFVSLLAHRERPATSIVMC